jgi:hypothetical protein
LIFISYHFYHNINGNNLHTALVSSNDLDAAKTAAYNVFGVCDDDKISHALWYAAFPKSVSDAAYIAYVINQKDTTMKDVFIKEIEKILDDAQQI